MHETQQAQGSWNVAGHEHAATGAAAFAFLNERDKWGENTVEYQAALQKAIGYLLNTAILVNVSTRDDAVNICPEAAPSCKGIYWLDGAEATVTTGIIALAIDTYGLTIGSDGIATDAGPLAGLTWQEIAQAITNALAATQKTSGATTRVGGWYSADTGKEESRNSATGSAVVSLIYNESVGAITPESLKEKLRIWVNNVHHRSGAGCNQPDSNSCDHAERDAWMIAVKFVGESVRNTQFQTVFASLNTEWKTIANTSASGNFGHPFAMWSLYTGLEPTIGLDDSAHITNFLTGCGETTGSAGCTWSEDYTEWLVRAQNSNGGWDGYSAWTGPLATALYINILGAVRIPVGPYECPENQSFWISAPASWPSNSLRVGGQTYTKQELLALLSTPPGAGMPVDASVALAGELISARFNIARGSDRMPVASVIAEADALLATFSGKLPFNIAPDSFTGQKLTDLAKRLSAYNSGSLTPSCTVASKGSTAGAAHGVESTLQVEARTAHVTGGGTAATASTMQPAGVGTLAAKLRPRARTGVTGLAISADGSAVASASTDKRIRIWSTTTGGQKVVLSGSMGLPTSLAFHPTGDTLSSAGRDSVIRIWDPVKGAQTATLAGHEHAIRAVAVSPDGRFLASAGEESRIMLWDLSTRKLSKILYGSADFVNALSFSPDSRLLASAGEDARVLVFDIGSGKTLYTLRGHSGPVDAVVFSPDGTMLASGGQDTVIHLWNTANGQQSQALKGHAAPIETIAFSPDGQSIASGGEDALIILWDARTGLMDRTLFGSKGAINVVAFAPHAKLLAAASDAGDITLWNLASGAKMLTIPVPTAP